MELVSLVGKQDFILDHLRELRREIIMSGESPVLPARLTDALHLLDKLDNCAPDNENPKEDS